MSGEEPLEFFDTHCHFHVHVRKLLDTPPRGDGERSAASSAASCCDQAAATGAASDVPPAASNDCTTFEVIAQPVIHAFAPTTASVSVTLSVAEADFDCALRCAAGGGCRVVAGVGLHPWQVAAHCERVGEEYTALVNRMDAILSENAAVIVGEIGLDKIAAERLRCECFPHLFLPSFLLLTRDTHRACWSVASDLYAMRIGAHKNVRVRRSWRWRRVTAAPCRCIV